MKGVDIGFNGALRCLTMYLHHSHLEPSEFRERRGFACCALVGGGGPLGRPRRLFGALVLALGLIATSCSADDDPESLSASPPDAAESQQPDTTGSEPAVEPEPTTQPRLLEALPQDLPERAPLLPAPEAVQRVLAAAEQAAPESDLSLRNCTDWVASPTITLPPDQTATCIAKLNAATNACAGLGCLDLPPHGAAPPVDRGVVEADQADGTAAAEPADPTGDETPPVSNDPPATTSPVEVVTTTTQRPDPAPTTTTTPSGTTATTSSTSTTSSTTTSTTTTTSSTTTTTTTVPWPEPVGGHPPVPVAGMVPRNEPYWDYPMCQSGPPWPSDCFPPSEWEIPQDLSECFVAPVPEAGVGGICASRRPDDSDGHQELPRQIQEVIDYIDWCEPMRSPLSCGYTLFQMKWSLDYLGAHPWCVLQQYYDRINAHVARRNGGPGNINQFKNNHGWHKCATVIDPILPTDPTAPDSTWVRLSETGISLAEQCRIVLPADIELETTTDKTDQNPEEFGSDCDAWAEYIENVGYARKWRVCNRSARLAEEWMEHHYATPEFYFPVDC